MATMNIPNQFTNGTTANATEVNANFQAVKSHVETNCVTTDGAVKAGVGALDFGMTGLITPFAGATAPTGWLLCRGQLVSKTTYASLYAVLGANAFGTDTGSEFYLPNLQGRVPVGVSTTDTDFDRADTGGVKDVTLTAAQSGLVGHNHTQNPHSHTQDAHSHNVATTVNFGTHIHDNNSSGGDYLASGTNGAGANDATIATAQPSINSTTATNNAVADANAAQAHTNLQPYIALNYIIKF